MKATEERLASPTKPCGLLPEPPNLQRLQTPQLPELSLELSAVDGLACSGREEEGINTYTRTIADAHESEQVACMGLDIPSYFEQPRVAATPLTQAGSGLLRDDEPLGRAFPEADRGVDTVHANFADFCNGPLDGIERDAESGDVECFIEEVLDGLLGDASDGLLVPNTEDSQKDVCKSHRGKDETNDKSLPDSPTGDDIVVWNHDAAVSVIRSSNGLSRHGESWEIPRSLPAASQVDCASTYSTPAAPLSVPVATPSDTSCFDDTPVFPPGEPLEPCSLSLDEIETLNAQMEIVKEMLIEAQNKQRLRAQQQRAQPAGKGIDLLDQFRYLQAEFEALQARANVGIAASQADGCGRKEIMGPGISIDPAHFSHKEKQQLRHEAPQTAAASVAKSSSAKPEAAQQAHNLAAPMEERRPQKGCFACFFPRVK